MLLFRNKDSLMAVLEAFVYDPLLNWRLIDNKPKSKKSKTHGEVLLRITLILGHKLTCVQVGLSVASKAGSTLSTGSSEGNMESLVDYHKEVASRKSEGTGASGESVEPEALNKKALDIVQRVRFCDCLA